MSPSTPGSVPANPTRGTEPEFYVCQTSLRTASVPGTCAGCGRAIDTLPELGGRLQVPRVCLPCGTNLVRAGRRLRFLPPWTFHPDQEREIVKSRRPVIAAEGMRFVRVLTAAGGWIEVPLCEGKWDQPGLRVSVGHYVSHGRDWSASQCASCGYRVFTPGEERKASLVVCPACYHYGEVVGTLPGTDLVEAAGGGLAPFAPAEREYHGTLTGRYRD